MPSILGGTLLVLVLFTLILIILRNTLIAKKNDVENAFAGIDVQLTKRYDLIPNLINSLKKYMAHETETLEKLTKLRAKAISGNISDSEKVKVGSQTSKLLGKMMVSVENYPELKASQNFLDLQRSLNEVEEQLSAARRFFNAAVTDYNNAVEMFPTSVIASSMSYKKKELFIAEDFKRENVDIGKLLE